MRLRSIVSYIIHIRDSLCVFLNNCRRYDRKIDRCSRANCEIIDRDRNLDEDWPDRSSSRNNPRQGLEIRAALTSILTGEGLLIRPPFPSNLMELN